MGEEEELVKQDILNHELSASLPGSWCSGKGGIDSEQILWNMSKKYEDGYKGKKIFGGWSAR